VKILMVDSDRGLIQLAAHALRNEGHRVLAAADGAQALVRLERENPDLILLDAKLPRLNGFEMCRRIRQESDTPIIMLGARNEESIVRALHLGADDYLAKPFSVKQLTVRVQAIDRRCRKATGDPAGTELRIGDLTMDLESHETVKGGRPIQLTPLEFRILHVLAANPGRVIPYTRLVDHTWGYDSGDATLLRTHVCHIREKLGMPPDGADGIKALRSVGYCFMPAA
jgi:two-component system response regulator MtrA